MWKTKERESHIERVNKNSNETPTSPLSPPSLLPLLLLLLPASAKLLENLLIKMKIARKMRRKTWHSVCTKVQIHVLAKATICIYLHPTQCLCTVKNVCWNCANIIHKLILYFNCGCDESIIMSTFDATLFLTEPYHGICITHVSVGTWIHIRDIRLSFPKCGRVIRTHENCHIDEREIIKPVACVYLD